MLCSEASFTLGHPTVSGGVPEIACGGVGTGGCGYIAVINAHSLRVPVPRGQVVRRVGGGSFRCCPSQDVPRPVVSVVSWVSGARGLQDPTSEVLERLGP